MIDCRTPESPFTLNGPGQLEGQVQGRRRRRPGPLGEGSPWGKGTARTPTGQRTVVPENFSVPKRNQPLFLFLLSLGSQSGWLTALQEGPFFTTTRALGSEHPFLSLSFHFPEWGHFLLLGCQGTPISHSGRERVRKIRRSPGEQLSVLVLLMDTGEALGVPLQRDRPFQPGC